MIIGIDLPKLRNPEYIQYMKNVGKIVLANNPATLLVQVPYDGLQDTVGNLEMLYKLEQGSALTEDITAADARRDRAVTGIAQFIGAHTYHFDDAAAKHAEALQRVLKQYGSGIARENYQAETAIIDNLVVDFDSKPECAAAITALGLTGWKKELDNANKAFNDLYLQRTQQLGAVTEDTLFAQRQLANNVYYKLRDFLNSYYTINNGADPYGKTCRELNALIEQYNTMLAGKSGKTDPEPVAPAA